MARREYGINRPISEALTGKYGSHIVDTSDWSFEQELKLAKKLAFAEGKESGEDADINWFEGFDKKDCDDYPRDAKQGARNALSRFEVDGRNCCGHIIGRFNHNLPKGDIEQEWEKGYKDAALLDVEFLAEEYKFRMKEICGIDLDAEERSRKRKSKKRKR